jgi:hypothetical protein
MTFPPGCSIGATWAVFSKFSGEAGAAVSALDLINYMMETDPLLSNVGSMDPRCTPSSVVREKLYTYKQYIYRLGPSPECC